MAAKTTPQPNYAEKIKALADKYGITLVPAKQFADSNEDFRSTLRYTTYRHNKGRYDAIAMSDPIKKTLLVPDEGYKWRQMDYFAALHEMGHIETSSESANIAMRHHGLINAEAQAWDWAFNNAGENPTLETCGGILQDFSSYMDPGSGDNMNAVPYEEGLTDFVISVANRLFSYFAAAGDLVQAAELRFAFKNYADKMNNLGGPGENDF